MSRTQLICLSSWRWRCGWNQTGHDEMRWPSCDAGTQIHHITGLTGVRTALVTSRPCRAPHHPLSAVGRISRGQVPLSAKVSPSHLGIGKRSGGHT
jgi:hypothetical protein